MTEDYKEPLYLKNGEQISEGDRISHAQFGGGKVLKLVTADGQGPILYIEFDRQKAKPMMIDPKQADMWIDKG